MRGPVQVTAFVGMLNTLPAETWAFAVIAEKAGYTADKDKTKTSAKR